jgi:integrase
VADKDRRTYGTGSVYYNERLKRWVGQDRDANAKRVTVYGKTKSEAERKLAAVRGKLARGETIGTNRDKLGPFLELWLEGIKRRRAHKTWIGYRINVQHHILPYLGNVPIGRLTVHQVQKMLDALEDGGLSPTSVRYVRSTLRSALSTAERQGIVTRNVAKLVELPDWERPQVQPLTPEDAAKFLAVARGDRLEAVYTVAMALGLRLSETLGLRWEDVDLDARRVRVRVQLLWKDKAWHLVGLKSAKSRRDLPLPDMAVDVLRAHRVRQVEERLRLGELWQRDDLVFLTSHGTPLGQRNVYRYFVQLCKKAGIDHHRFHDLRHTCAALLRAQGVSLEDVSAILGHSGIQITNDTYGHLYEEQRRKVADAMDRALKRQAQ